MSGRFDLNFSPSVAPTPEHGPLDYTHSLFPSRGGAGMMPRTIPMPGVLCRKCAERGVEVWVIPGRACGYCRTPALDEDSLEPLLGSDDDAA
ncbi:hypothetical protein QBC42DRAFT_41749 [Cladorrhinum samala]|uniref:Uncharacterized protein n=1 Tax=Cladorrhinum samala TaxID=585594 RepID=A0AAV9I7J3_9PEZI|nr:hypothetical protein QBC42DRAFT_41749 [Cladorrhinum samala]